MKIVILWQHCPDGLKIISVFVTLEGDPLICLKLSRFALTFVQASRRNPQQLSDIRNSGLLITKFLLEMLIIDRIIWHISWTAKNLVRFYPDHINYVSLNKLNIFHSNRLNFHWKIKLSSREYRKIENFWNGVIW